MLSQEHILGKDPSKLVEYASGFLLLPEVAKAFKQLQRAAQQDGVDVQIVSSYRSFDRQLLIWEKKWSGKTTLLDIDERPIQTDTLNDWQKIQTILTWSALPGASRHHWGTDLDVYDKSKVLQSNHNFQLVSAEYSQHGPCYLLNQWLSKYAADFGFSRPYSEYRGGIACEPWHLSYQPISEQIVEQLQADLLLDTLQQAKISGLASITDKMPEIFPRFVLNKGQK